MLELRKSCTTTTPLTPETTATAMQTALDTVIEQLKPDIPSLKMDQPLIRLKEVLAPYVKFLCVKAKRYFSLASYPFQYHIITLSYTFTSFTGYVKKKNRLTSKISSFRSIGIVATLKRPVIGWWWWNIYFRIKRCRLYKVHRVRSIKVGIVILGR